MQSDKSYRRIKFLIGITLFCLSIVLFAISPMGRFEAYMMAASIYGFVDFLYQDLFPQWWHWGRWAGHLSDEVSEEVIEFVGFFAMGIGCLGLGLTWFL